VTCREIIVDGKNIKHVPNPVVHTRNSYVSIQFSDLRVGGIALSNANSRIYAQTRNVSSDTLSWSEVYSSGGMFYLESTATVTSVTLFYRMDAVDNNSSNSRMFPFFTFTVVQLP